MIKSKTTKQLKQLKNVTIKQVYFEDITHHIYNVTLISKIAWGYICVFAEKDFVKTIRD